MLALITLATWEVVAALALVALFVALWLHARHWSVKRLVRVAFNCKDGTREDFITFPWNLKELYIALAGNPRFPDCYKYDVHVNCDVTRITRSRFKPDLWRYSIGHHYHFEREAVLWDSGHALLVNVLRDFGLNDNQPMDVRVLSVFSNQRLDALAMRLTLSNRCRTSELADNHVAYLELLHACLIQAIEKKWTRENRYERFSGKLPGTDELVMELIATDEGAKRVLACINRNWKPEPKPEPTSPPKPPTHHSCV